MVWYFIKIMKAGIYKTSSCFQHDLVNIHVRHLLASKTQMETLNFNLEYYLSFTTKLYFLIFHSKNVVKFS